MGEAILSGKRRGAGGEVPLYQTIRKYLVDMIASGDLRPGDKLPSEAELAAKFDTTRGTVVHALQQLVFEQAIVRHAGKGSFVSNRRYEAPLNPTRVQSLEGQLRDLGESVAYRFLQYSALEADPTLSAELKLKIGSKVFRLERLRIANGAPISFEVRFIPYDIGRRISLGAFEEFSFIDILQDQIGLTVGRIEGTIAAVEADREQAKLLDVPAFSALLTREYLFFTPRGEPISKGLSYYRKEVQFRYFTVQSPSQT